MQLLWAKEKGTIEMSSLQHSRVLMIKGPEQEEASPTHPFWERTETGEWETRRQCAIKAAARCWINDNICMRVWATIEAVTMETGAKASGGKKQAMMKGSRAVSTLAQETEKTWACHLGNSSALKMGFSEDMIVKKVDDGVTLLCSVLEFYGD
ncbi:hypothetical protein HGM15179_003123 [Zosterops borbonicus]|uniref:Uncharacterized protein n=1 Tax=Zosterops borbonicus TaxID=364589 RepID=A0A8K1GUA6_9PASS|nr:hypothetical protein HGM15179_003123 [Zosterops borbonicus]